MNNQRQARGAVQRSSGDTVDLREMVDTSAAAEPPEKLLTLRPDVNGRVLAHRYALIGMLGSGGMGRVFKALDWQRRELAEPDRHVAVKVLRRDGADGARLAADLRREFYCAQALSHPNIVKVYETGQDGEVCFFTMEMLEGETLRAVLERTRPAPLPRERAWAIIRDIGAGLAHAHSRQVVHGDLKPANVMVTSDGEIRILDFGASGSLRRVTQEVVDVLQRDSTPAVTPAYTCCELLAGLQADPRDDLYALACLSYELLAGCHPFQGRSAFAARQQGMEPQRPPGLTRRQWHVLRQGLAWQREDRALTVNEWLGRLGLLPGLHRLPGSRRLVSRLPSWPKQWRGTAAQVRHAVLGGGLLASVCLLLVHNLAAPTSTAASDGHATGVIVRTAGAAPTAPAPVDSRAREDAAAPVPVSSRPQGPVRVWAAGFRVLPGERFAQVTVMRSAAVSQTKFTWWTEADSARPGSDFVEQRPARQTFSKGRRTTNVFVRLLPNESRKSSESFFVAIGTSAGGTSPRTVTRTAIRIPAESAAMVASN